MPPRTKTPPNGVATDPRPIPEPAPLAQAPDVGDRVFVTVWRPTQAPRPGEPLGSWLLVYGRVLAVRRDGTMLSYETESPVPPEPDTPYGVQNRFAKREHVFSDQAAADEACRTLSPPT